MSRTKLKSVQNFEFVERFIEVCGSSQPIDVARLLNISYQAARNYLNGRLPDSNVLLIISRKTDYSLHWLLTGEGEKFVLPERKKDTLVLSDELKQLVRAVCLQAVSEISGSQNKTAQPRVVVLTPDNIKSEKPADEVPVLSDKKD